MNKYILDGYYFDLLDKSCIILISDFIDSIDNITLTSTEINKLFDNMKNFALTHDSPFFVKLLKSISILSLPKLEVYIPYNPEMFFAYNNGIAATATEIELFNNDKGIYIKSLKDLQIINGGQTTASIANAKIQDKVDLHNVYVPMKLSIVDNEKAKLLIV